MLLRAIALLVRLEGFILGALMLGMSFLYTLNVFVRDIAPPYASRFAWIDELCLFGLAWMVFLGLGLGLDQGRHIGMTLLLRKLRCSLSRYIKAGINIVGAIFSLYIAQLCFDLTLLVLRSGQVSPTLGISMSWLYGPMPVGFLFLAARYTLATIGENDRFATVPDPTFNP